MRKATILMALVLFLSVCGVGVLAADIFEEHNQVVLTEKVIYGDRTKANGLSVQVDSHYRSRLFWNTTLQFNDAADVHTVLPGQPGQEYPPPAPPRCTAALLWPVPRSPAGACSGAACGRTARPTSDAAEAAARKCTTAMPASISWTVCPTRRMPSMPGSGSWYAPHPWRSFPS